MATAVNLLSVSRLVNVQIALTPEGAQSQNLSTMLYLSSDPVINTVERYRIYESYNEVIADFPAQGAGKAALRYFSQSPRPRRMIVGRWVRTAATGGLVGGVLPTTSTDISGWNAITDGGFGYQVNGAAVTNVAGLNFSAAVDLAGVASIINGALVGATFRYDVPGNRFEFRSLTTGPSSSISYTTPPPSGTSISNRMTTNSASESAGAYLYSGQNAESAAKVTQVFDDLIGRQWYALMPGFVTDDNRLEFARVIEATQNKHILGLTTQDAAVLSGASTNDIAQQLENLNLSRTILQYSSTSDAAVASTLGRLLTVDYNGSNTAITLMFKQQPQNIAENLSASQAIVLRDKNCNVFVAYDNDTAILQYGTMINGTFADIVTSSDWLATTLETSLYNVLYTSLTKIPQTDEGMHLLTTTCEGVLSQAVTNGMLAPGTWNAGGFGALQQGDFLSKGFYVYAPRVSKQNPADRVARKAVPIQIAAKLAGAVHEISVSVAVNQ